MVSPTEDTTEAAFAKANEMFTEKASEIWFSAQSCNRFHIQYLDAKGAKIALALGSVGVVQNLNPERSAKRSVATVDRVYLGSGPIKGIPMTATI
jgi:hypothetical protein